MSLELEGIGASLQTEDSYTLVRKIIPGGALDKMNKALAKTDKNGGIHLDDKIVGVGQGDEGRNGRRGRHEDQRRRRSDPRQAGDDRPPGGAPRRRQRQEDLQDHPREDRTERQRGARQGVRRRPEARRHALPHRRDRLAQLLPRHGGRPPRPGRLPQHHPRRPQSSSTTSNARASTPWSSISAPTAAVR